jgi:hypothetical protein
VDHRPRCSGLRSATYHRWQGMDVPRGFERASLPQFILEQALGHKLSAWRGISSNLVSVIPLYLSSCLRITYLGTLHVRPHRIIISWTVYLLLIWNCHNLYFFLYHWRCLIEGEEASQKVDFLIHGGWWMVANESRPGTSIIPDPLTVHTGQSPG